MKKINEIKEAKIRRWWKWSFLYIFKKKKKNLNIKKIFG